MIERKCALDTEKYHQHLLSYHLVTSKIPKSWAFRLDPPTFADFAASLRNSLRALCPSPRSETFEAVAACFQTPPLPRIQQSSCRNRRTSSWVGSLAARRRRSENLDSRSRAGELQPEAFQVGSTLHRASLTSYPAESSRSLAFPMYYSTSKLSPGHCCTGS